MKLHILSSDHMNAIVHGIHSHGEKLLTDTLAARRNIGENFKVLARSLDEHVALANGKTEFILAKASDLVEIVSMSAIEISVLMADLDEQKKQNETLAIANQILQTRFNEKLTFEGRLRFRLNMWGQSNEEVFKEIDKLASLKNKTTPKKKLALPAPKKSAKKRK